jgi:hypothetical protein
LATDKPAGGGSGWNRGEQYLLKAGIQLAVAVESFANIVR